MADPRFEVEGSATGEREDLYYSGVVTDAFFSQNEYGLSLNVKSALDSPELFPFLTGGGEHTRFFGCGRGKDGAWVTLDSGATAVFQDALSGAIDETKKFNASSPIGVLLNHFATHDDVGRAMPANWSAYDARTWKGLWINWGPVSVPARRRKLDPSTGAELEKDGRPQWFNTTTLKAMPIEVRASGATQLPLPAQGGAGNGQAGGVTTAAPFDLASLPIDDEGISELRAVTKDTHTASLGAWLKVPGVAGNAPLVDILSDAEKGEAVRVALSEAF